MDLLYVSKRVSAVAALAVGDVFWLIFLGIRAEQLTWGRGLLSFWGRGLLSLLENESWRIIGSPKPEAPQQFSTQLRAWPLKKLDYDWLSYPRIWWIFNTVGCQGYILRDSSWGLTAVELRNVIFRYKTGLWELRKGRKHGNIWSSVRLGVIILYEYVYE